MTQDEAAKKQLKKAERHHTKPTATPRKGATGHGVVRTDRGEDQPADKTRARKT